MVSIRFGALVLVTVLALSCSSTYYFGSYPTQLTDNYGNLELPIGPFLIPAGPGEILIGAQLPDGEQGRVEFWPVGENEKVSEALMSPSWDRFVYARLTSLEAGQRYEYRIVVKDHSTVSYSVLPTPTKEQPFVFVVMGDSKLGCRQAHCKIVRELEKHPAELYIHLGDLVRTGDNTADWGDFFRIEKNLLAATPIAPVLGNHDQSIAGFFEKIFLLPQVTGGTHRYFSFNYGNSLFIVLDGVGAILTGDTQLCFLERALQQAKVDEVEHIFVAVHSPLYSSGKHGADPGHRAALLPLLEKYGVTAVFSGHDHHYERSKPQNGVVHFVSGGAGAELTPVNQQAHAARVLLGFHFLKITVLGPTVILQAISDTGQVLDEVKIK